MIKIVHLYREELGDKIGLVVVTNADEFSHSELLWPLSSAIIARFSLDYLWLWEMQAIAEYSDLSIFDHLDSLAEKDYCVTELEESEAQGWYGNKIILIKNPPSEVLKWTFTKNWLELWDCSVFKLDQQHISEDLAEICGLFDIGASTENMRVIDIIEVAIMRLHDGDGIGVYAKREHELTLRNIISDYCEEFGVSLVIET